MYKNKKYWTFQSTQFQVLFHSHSYQTVWNLWRDEYTDQQNKTEKPEIDPHKYYQLILATVQKQFNGGRILFINKLGYS